MKKPQICLVEPRPNHEEVLFPLIDLLHDNYDVYVLAPQSLLDGDILGRTKGLYEAIPIGWSAGVSRPRRLLEMWGMYRALRRAVDSIGARITLFNSSYSLCDVAAIAAAFKGVRKAQIIHNFQYFLWPGMRRLYDQFDLNLVISDDVHDYILQNHPRFRSLDYFLPIFFDGFLAASPTGADPPRECDGLLHLGAFGAIDNQRRNYEGLLGSLAAWRRSGRDFGFVVHLVGKLPPQYRDFVQEHDLGQVVRCYDRFVPFEEMFRVLRRVDMVMFLIDSTVRYSSSYNRYKISGTSTLVKSFRKACAASRDFRLDAALTDKCFWYDGARIEQIFQGIADGSITAAAARQIEARYANLRLLSREEQQARLLGALERLDA
jgi:hypothetical protein